MEHNILGNIQSAWTQCRKRMFKGVDDVMPKVRTVIYEYGRRVLGKNSVQQLGVILRTDLDDRPLVGKTGASGMNVDADNRSAREVSLPDLSEDPPRTPISIRFIGSSFQGS